MTEINLNQPPSEDVAEIQAEAVEAVAEAQTEAAEAVADSSVEIAQIEAERDIQMAEINAAVALEEIAQRSEERDEQWQENLSERLNLMDSKIEALMEQQSLILSNSPPQPETVTETVTEAAEPVTETEPVTVAELTIQAPESAEENPVQHSDQKPQKRRTLLI